MASAERSNPCDGAGLVQWGIRVADGAVFPAHGSPPPLAGVERVIVRHTARFKIPLPSHSGITIVYSDSDDGRRQESLIASSELRFGEPETLGQTYDVKAEAATSLVKKGALEPIRLPLQSDGKAVTDISW